MSKVFFEITDLYGNKVLFGKADLFEQLATCEHETPIAPFVAIDGVKHPMDARKDEVRTLGDYLSDAVLKVIYAEQGVATTVVLMWSQSGCDHYTVYNHAWIEEAEVPHGIKDGELFDIYVDGSVNRRIEWQDNLIGSLLNVS
jgi:hypothetical protein